LIAILSEVETSKQVYCVENGWHNFS